MLPFLLILAGLCCQFVEAAQPQATLLFAGDAMMHQAQIDAARRSDGSYNYDSCFVEVAPIIRNADYAIVNLETPLGGAPYSGYPCFCAPDSYATALTDAGFDLFLTANNHTLDRRDRGLRRTAATLDSLRIPHLGTYTNAAQREERLPMIKTINGFKVAMLNYTYGTNGISVQGDAVVDYIDRPTIDYDVAKARAEGAEIIMAAIHWGNEYQLLPHASQRELAQFLVDQGVELIIGGHPHVIQPMEMRRGKDGRNTLVVYSLGNFISNMKTRDTRGGALVEATLRRDSTGRAYVADAQYRLVFTEAPSAKSRQFKLYPAEDVTSGPWASHCKAFTLSATAIFDRNNIDVSRNTTHMVYPVIQPIVDRIHPYALWLNQFLNDFR